MITAVLIRLKNGQYRVSGVGKQPFWPHDGDIITENDIPWLTEKKGWAVEIVEEK